MRQKLFAAATLGMLTAFLGGCSSEAAEAPSGVDLGSLDRSAAPCTDFYQFACGGWITSHPLSQARSRDAAFFTPYETTLPQLLKIVEDDAKGARKADDPYAELIGRHYRSCTTAPTDVTARAALAAQLAKIDAVTDLDGLARQMADQRALGSNTFFHFAVARDPADANRAVVALDQGGGELGPREYYVAPEHEALREDYRVHIRRMSALVGGTPVDPFSTLKVETALSVAALLPAERRDPTLLHHVMTSAEAGALVPTFPLEVFWKQLGIPSPARVDVAVPAYFKALEALFKSTSIEDLKSYMRWQLLQDTSALLDQAFLDEDFRFWKRFDGATSPPSTTSRCFFRTLDSLGDAISLPYVARHFDEAKAVETRRMFDNLRDTFKRRIQESAWLDAPTRDEAERKLLAVLPKIGHPSTKPDYGGLTMDAPTFFENQTRLRQFSVAREKTQLDRPLDRTEWPVSATTLNAFYEPETNSVVFPAILLSKPLLEVGRPSAANYGGLGYVIGHELTHGFDDQGRRLDASGALRDFWSPAVAASFESRAQCVADQFSSLEALPGQKIDGKLTLGENIADLGGVDLAYDALFRGADAPVQGGDGFDAKQVFFLAFAQTQCSVERPESAAESLRTDPHSPSRFRVNATLSNLPAFREAFTCPTPSPMSRPQVCKVW